MHFYTNLLTIVCLLFQGGIAAQNGKFIVEGGDELTVTIHSYEGGPLASGLDLLTGDQFTGTDWRILNEGGVFKFMSNIDNFSSSGDENFRIFNSGTLLLPRGSEASVGNLSGVLVIGDEAGLNMALDDNEILARNDDTDSDLFIQAGTSGNTYINLSDGNVGIGPFAGGTSAKTMVSDDLWQFRLVNTVQSASSWYIGASNTSWGIGGDRLVFSSTSATADAMFVLDDTNDRIDVRNNRVINLSNPILGSDAVNRSWLESFVQQYVTQEIGANSQLAPKDLSSAAADVNFSTCATRCRDLVEDGHSDWTIPSLEQLSHYVGFPGITAPYWTSDYEHSTFQSESGNLTGQSSGRVVIFMGSGSEFIEDDLSELWNCRCVR